MGFRVLLHLPKKDINTIESSAVVVAHRLKSLSLKAPSVASIMLFDQSICNVIWQSFNIVLIDDLI
jgi:hypothetical protein